MWLALGIFVATYAAVALLPGRSERFERPAIALVGGIIMVVAGVLSTEEAFAAVDVPVIALLLGMMIIASGLTHARFFRHIAWHVLTRAKSPRSLLWLLVFASGTLSAFLLNDTVCVMFTPLVVAVVAQAQLPALPYLLALATASNIGGVVSFTGNPQNLLIGQAASGSLSYAEYLLRTLPAGVVCLAATAWLLTWLFRRELDSVTLGPRDAPRPYLDRHLATTSLVVLFGFSVAALAGVSLPGAAIAAAGALLLVARPPARELLAGIDLSLLLLFVGLFVVVDGLQVSGASQAVFSRVLPSLSEGQGDLSLVGITIIGSNLVSNLPFVILALDPVAQHPDPAQAYSLLAVTATLAGNMTLFGSVANLIVFESAGPRGRIGFFRFARYGILVTALTLSLALAILWLGFALVP